MANLQRIPTTHDGLFPVPVVLMGVEPMLDFDKQREGLSDPQQRDKETGVRLWAVSIIDPHQPAGRRELKVRIAAEVQPVPSTPVGQPVEFDNLEVVPYLDQNRTRPRVAVSLRAGGFKAPVKVKAGN